MERTSSDGTDMRVVLGLAGIVLGMALLFLGFSQAGGPRDPTPVGMAPEMPGGAGLMWAGWMFVAAGGGLLSWWWFGVRARWEAREARPEIVAAVREAQAAQAAAPAAPAHDSSPVGAVVCSACTRRNAPDTRFCGQCGARIAS